MQSKRPPRHWHRHWRPIAALAALILPMSAAAAADWLNVSIYAAEKPDQYIYVVYNRCHERGNWRGNADGCTAWIKSQMDGNFMAYDPLGNRKIKLNARFYIIPVCAGDIFWRNNIPGKGTSDLKRIQLKCRH